MVERIADVQDTGDRNMTLVKTVKDIAISLTGDGKFTATINGETVTKATLAQIEKAINGAPKPPVPVKVMRPQAAWRCSISTDTIVNTRQRGRFTILVTEKDVELSGHEATGYKVYDEAVYADGQKIVEEYKEMKNRHTKETNELQLRFRNVFSNAVNFDTDMLKGE